MNMRELGSLAIACFGNFDENRIHNDNKYREFCRDQIKHLTSEKMKGFLSYIFLRDSPKDFREILDWMENYQFNNGEKKWYNNLIDQFRGER